MRKQMKKREIFSGVGTALITPFRDGQIDYPALSALIEGQIAAGVDALIVGGTTGEAATLTDKERYTLYRFCADRVAGRTKLIFGTGTNDTSAALAHTKAAASLGADGALCVTPYYNKGTEAGLEAHYRTIAEEGGLPVILYNVPSRTGVNLSLKLLKKLSKLQTIVGIKEASDSAERLISLAALGDALPLYAGNDSAAYTVFALGGRGVISVVSNLFPARTRAIGERWFAGDAAGAFAAQKALLPLAGALFAETNPTPVKYAASLLGLCRAEVRLPLAEAAEGTKARIRRATAKLLSRKEKDPAARAGDPGK